LTSIEDLYLQYNNISEIEGLEFHRRLKFLALGNNKISKVENLCQLKNLQVLDLRYNQIDDLDVDEFPRSLRNLDLRGNKCTTKNNYYQDILTALPNLVYLDGAPLSKGKEENEEQSTPRSKIVEKSKSIRKQPLVTTDQSGALMDAAMAEIQSMADAAKARTKALIQQNRSKFATSSRVRMQQQEELFKNRVPHTVENTLQTRPTTVNQEAPMVVESP